MTITLAGTTVPQSFCATRYRSVSSAIESGAALKANTVPSRRLKYRQMASYAPKVNINNGRTMGTSSISDHITRRCGSGTDPSKRS